MAVDITVDVRVWFELDRDEDGVIDGSMDELELVKDAWVGAGLEVGGSGSLKGLVERLNGLLGPWEGPDGESVGPVGVLEGLAGVFEGPLGVSDGAGTSVDGVSVDIGRSVDGASLGTDESVDGDSVGKSVDVGSLEVLIGIGTLIEVVAVSVGVKTQEHAEDTLNAIPEHCETNVGRSVDAELNP